LEPGDEVSSYVTTFAGDEDVDYQKCQQLASAALDCLDERERTIFLLRFWEQQSYEEIGSQVGVTRERVRQIIASAIALIQENFRKRGITPPEGLLTTK